MRAGRTSGYLRTVRILLVEDNVRLVQSLVLGLSEEGLTTTHVATGGEALAKAEQAELDAVILDLGLPDMDGLEVLRGLRSGRHGHIPVLVLTARDAVEVRVAALDAGADDYVIKPFVFVELVARVRALIRRAAGPRWTPLVSGRLALGDDHSVVFGSQRVELSPREHGLLAYLLRRRGEVVPRADILKEVFGYVGDPGTNAIDVHLVHLRRKLAGAPLVLETIRGAGIRARVEEEG